MADAPPMRLLEALEFALEKIEPLHIGDNRRLSRLVRRLEIRGIQRATHTMIGDQLIQPGEPVEVIPVELAGCRLANCGEPALGAAFEYGPIRHVRQASDRQRSAAHRFCEIAARRRLRRDAGAAAMAMDIDGNGVAQDGKCRRRGLGGLRRCRRTARPSAAGEHRADRDGRGIPHPGLGCSYMAVTATIHGILPAIATALAYVAVIVFAAHPMTA